ncbi:hypothetical protein CMV30_01430 [Nibricoccus aquaticus]|uniref:Uncharacterized protein n=2 Tax=Nibricoccus aquaticus TaxID=2576891 RepID=A0A290Q2U3_9BACT|nr:hypothetical protein CMV30_01430 [Nibricoccus aquaticus]
MVAATIFTIFAVSATGLFIQNQRASVGLRYRTQVTNTALNILEQLRLKNYNELKALRAAALLAPTGTHTTTVLVGDPLYVPPTVNPYASLNLPAGLRPEELILNVLDGTVISINRTNIKLPMESGLNTTKLDTRYWLSMKYNESLSTPIVQAIEIALIYQWKMPQRTNWQEGTIRLVVINPQAVKNVASAAAL